MCQIILIILLSGLLSSTYGYQEECLDYEIDDKRANLIDCSMRVDNIHYKQMRYFNATHQIVCYVESYMQCLPARYNPKLATGLGCLGCCDQKTKTNVPAKQNYSSEYFGVSGLCKSGCIEEVFVMDIANGCQI